MTIEVGNIVLPVKNNIYMNWPVKDGCDVVGIVTKIKRNKLNPRDPELPEFSYEVLVAEKTIFIWEVDVKVLV